MQLAFLRTIKGLERCVIATHGHAVEYQVVDTQKLTKGLEYRDIPGLYFAGQVNGTSGYEEAGGQGLLAGINASFALRGRGVFSLAREESYLGVMIDDLTGQSRDEPYRLFTARNENRLYAREDNTFLRMAPYRQKLGLRTALDDHLGALMAEYRALSALVERHVFSPKTGAGELVDGEGKSLPIPPGGLRLSDLLKDSRLDPANVLRGTLAHGGLAFSPRVVEAVAIGQYYGGYIERGRRELRGQQKLDRAKVRPQGLLASANISFECKQRIKQSMPETFGQLRRIEGIRPATLAYVSSQL